MAIRVTLSGSSLRPIRESEEAAQPKALTVEDIEGVAETEGIDLGDISRDELLLGLAVEYEHGSRLGADINLTKDEDGPALKIAVAHLREIPDYYTRLAVMEQEAKEGVPQEEEEDAVEDVEVEMPTESRKRRLREAETVAPAQRTIPIKYMHGKMDWRGQLWSAAAVTQVLTAIQDDLKAVFGQYVWYLDGDTGDYQIVAKSLDSKDSWVDGHGRTPKLAVMDCNATRTIFQKNGWLKSSGDEPIDAVQG